MGIDMKLDDLIEIYDIKKRQFGDKAYLHISEIFDEARERYKTK